MTTSGTVSATVYTTRQVMETAARRCGVSPSVLTPEGVQIMSDNLWLLLSELANEGAPLWCIERLIMPLYEGVASITLPVGTVDVLNANLRSLQEVTGTNTDTTTQRSIEFSSSTAVTSVGIKWDATPAPLSFARSDDGVTWTTIQTETAADEVSGQWTWYDMDTVIAATYFRVQATSGTLDFETLYTGNMPSEVPFGRLSRDQYTALANKNFQSSMPIQYYLERLVPQAIMQLNPVPNDAAEVKQVIVWRHRHIMDVGTMPQTLEIPQRWYEAVSAMLAARVVIELPDADIGREPMLTQRAGSALMTAQNEEYDNSTIQWAPDISAYTA